MAKSVIHWGRAWRVPSLCFRSAFCGAKRRQWGRGRASHRFTAPSLTSLSLSSIIYRLLAVSADVLRRYKWPADVALCFIIEFQFECRFYWGLIRHSRPVLKTEDKAAVIDDERAAELLHSSRDGIGRGCKGRRSSFDRSVDIDADCVSQR